MGMSIYDVIEESIHLYMNSREWHYTKGIVAEIPEKFKKEIFLDLIYRYNHQFVFIILCRVLSDVIAYFSQEF